MMKLYSLMVFSLLVTMLAACSKDRVYGNLYDGLQKREQMVNPATSPAGAEQQSYDGYQRDRARSLSRDE